MTLSHLSLAKLCAQIQICSNQSDSEEYGSLSHYNVPSVHCRVPQQYAEWVEVYSVGLKQQLVERVCVVQVANSGAYAPFTIWNREDGFIDISKGQEILGNLSFADAYRLGAGLNRSVSLSLAKVKRDSSRGISAHSPWELVGALERSCARENVLNEAVSRRLKKVKRELDRLR